MAGVLHGFVLILTVIGTGYVAARAGVVKSEQRQVLNNITFYVATPMLLFAVLHDSDPAIMLSPVIVVTTLAAVAVAGCYVIASRFWFKQPLADTTLGATASGYVNAQNLGLPVAIYILGDAAYVAPLMLVQLIIYTPVVLAILEASRGGQRGALKALWRAGANPIIIASVLGFLTALFEVPIPQIVLEPIDMIGAVAIPLILISFGVSLRGQRALQPGSNRTSVLVATGLKALAMPAVAWALTLAFRLEPHEAFVAITIAALPTAQNLSNYAATYRQAETMVRDTILITTFTSLPVIALIALLFSA